MAWTTRFEIVRQVGRGGMGVVYQVRNRTTGEDLALKTLPRPDAEGLLRLKREFRALQGLAHPNLVRLEDLGESEGSVYFTMELLEGCSLLEWIGGAADGPPDDVTDTVADRAGASSLEDPHPKLAATDHGAGARSYPRPGFDERRLRQALPQLAFALCALHDAGLVHRDVKPSNILVTPAGRLVLLDLGLVQSVSDGASTGGPVGTFQYMAPEQAAGEPGTPRADWYAFGVVLFEALTGRLPYDATGLRVLLDKQSPAPPPSRFAQGVPDDLETLCRSLLEVDPARRPTGKEVLRFLGKPAGPDSGSISLHSAAPLFVGRERELAQLSEGYAATRRGEPKVVLLEGESGVGKSLLVDHFVEKLRALGKEAPLVLAGRCFERESIPFKGIDGVMDGLSSALRGMSPIESGSVLPRHPEVLTQVFPVLRRVKAFTKAAGASPLETDPRDRQGLFLEAMREVFLRLTDRGGLIVVIDDIQWADRDSFVVLADLLAGPVAPPMLLVLTARPNGLGSETLLARLGVPVEVMPIGTMNRREAEVLAGALLSRSCPAQRSRAEAIARESGGHPLFIDELVRHAALHDGPHAAARLDDVLRDRMRVLDPNARLVLELVAVAGAPLAEDEVATASELPPEALRSALATLRVGRLVQVDATAGRPRRLQPYHARVHEALLEELDEDLVRERHWAIAVALESGKDPDDERLAVHWRGAGATLRAASLYVRAGDRAMQDLAFDHAASLYRAAADIRPPDHPDRADVAAKTGEALARAGRPAEAARQLAVAADRPDPGVRLDLRIRGAEQLLLGGYVEEGLAAVTEILAEHGVDMPRTSRGAFASALWQRARLRFRGLRWTSRHQSQISPEALRRVDLFCAVAFGLGAVIPVTGRDFQTRALRLALDLGEPSRVAVCLGGEAAFSVLGERSTSPRPRLALEAAYDALPEAGDEAARLLLDGVKGTMTYLQGRFAEAAMVCEQTRARLLQRPVVSLFERNNTDLFLAFSLRHQGALRKLVALREEVLRDAVRRGDRYAETCFLRGTAIAQLAGGRPEEARRSLARAEWVPPGDVIHVQHWYELEAQAELALYTGTAARARADLEGSFDAVEGSLLRRVEIMRVLSRWLRGRVLLQCLAAGEPADVRQVAALIARLRRERVQHATVMADLLDAALAAQAGRQDAAVATLKRARALATEIGMVGSAAFAALRLGDLLPGAEGAQARQDAEAYAEAEGVVDLRRLGEVLVPGFAPPP